MYLKSLELQGFKSFPDKIKLSFDKGLTAVVGPNGSGKSNIGDAVRWVLGEQSTKTLRGNKMEDVIFSGTEARKPVGFAAVTLTIDNEQGELASEDREVSVTRRLFRSGESEYQINGKNVRLKDINELFMDTGLGRDGYSIIGQGRIAEIVGAKSNERRDIFEEAAGISKFRYKKQEAERRLHAAQENLVRLTDIVSELEGRVEPLRIQSGKAEKFLELAQQRKSLEISVWVNRLDTLREKLDALSEEALVAAAEYENLQNDIDREEAKIAEGYTRMQESAMGVERLRGQILEIEQNSAAVKADIAVSENDIQHSRAQIAQAEESHAAEQLSRTELTERIQAQQQRIAQLEQDAKDFAAQIQEAQQAFAAQEQEAAAAGKAYDEAGSAVNALYLEQSQHRFTQQAAREQITQLKQTLEGGEDTAARQAEQSAAYETALEQLSRQLEQAQNRIREQENRLGGYQRLYDSKMQKLAQQRKDWEAATLRLREKQQRRRLLQDLENSMEGFGRSIKEILRAGKSGRISGIHGSVAQLVSVKPEYGVAIETALGAAMQNIIVENEDIAKRCIRYLKEQRAGRATFLPLTSVRGNLLHEPNLSSMEGFVALAAELAACDAKYEGIFRSLLGRIAIAEDIDCATVIAKRFGYKFRIVTLDGQVINAGGSFTGGSAAHSSGVITRKNELDTLGTEIEALTAEQEGQRAAGERLKAETDKLRFDLDSTRDALSQAQTEVIRLTADRTAKQALAESARQQAATQQERVEQAKQSLARQEQLLAEATRALEQVDQSIARQEQALSAQQDLRSGLQQAREALSAQLAKLKLGQMECVKDQESARRELENMQQSAEQSQSRAAQLHAMLKEAERLIAQKEQAIARSQETLSRMQAETEACRQEITRLQGQHDSQQQYINQLREGMRAINEAKEKRAGEAMRIDERKITAQKDYDSLIMQLLETYELTRSEAEQLAEPLEDLQKAQQTLAQIKGKIKALGNVNVGAIEEYREVSERYTFLSAQVADVTGSKRELEKLIESLTEDMCRIFAESFVRINDNFKAIFKELFGGGHAELILTDPEHVLESGIEISVAPPGKVIKHLISLSGGEQSFVAICIYFAILKLRPAPFCILDEIDAALDEANVRKYAQYLHRFTEHTQFVLVTHRRSAMEEANVLYGVTMQADGVSRLLKLEQPDLDTTTQA